jgi:hypothetical protein
VRTRLATLLVLLAAGAAPLVASAGGDIRVGVMYSDSTLYPVEGGSSSQPYLDVDLGLDASGIIASRDVATYTLNARWTRIENDIPGVSSTQKYLTFNGHASILENPVSPIGLNLSASRGDNNFTNSANADSFGSGTQTTYGGGVRLRGEHLPTVDAGYSRMDSEAHIAGQPTRTSTLQSINSSLSLGTTAFNMAASYLGELHDGTWDTDNFATHGITLRANGWLGTNLLTIESDSVVTIPKQLVPGLFKQDTETFSALLSTGSLGDRRAFSYSYGHTITESPGAPTGEVYSQGLMYEGDHFRMGEFFTRWLLNASMNETRSDLAVLRSTGETGGVSLWWRRVTESSTLELNAGPRASVIQPVGESSRGGTGANAGARIQWPLGLHTLQLNWTGNYGRDLFASAGWQLTQDLGGSLSGPLSTARYTLSLRGSSFRTHSPVLGEGAGRILQVVATIAGARLSADARASMSSGIIGATPQQFVGDGLLVPAPFNSNVIDTSAGFTYKIFSGLGASTHLRWALSDIPGRPNLQEVGGIAGLTYEFGGLGLSVEDRYTRTEVETGWSAMNVFMATLYRSITW